MISTSFTHSMPEKNVIQRSKSAMRRIDLEAEREFENLKTNDGMVRNAQSKFYWATDLDTQFHIDLTNEKISGKNVLEIGCSTGRDAEIYSQHCNKYYGIDISDQAIDVATSKELKNCVFECVDGHTLPFSDSSIDCVIVNSLLHHLDLATSLREINRVLVDGGVLLFREPLGTNPVFEFYRFLTPRARTVDERPFTFADLATMDKYFELQNGVRWFGFTNIISAYIKSNHLRAFLTRLDQLFARTQLRYLFWQFSGSALVRKL